MIHNDSQQPLSTILKSFWNHAEIMLIIGLIMFKYVLQKLHHVTDTKKTSWINWHRFSKSICSQRTPAFQLGLGTTIQLPRPSGKAARQPARSGLLEDRRYPLDPLKLSKWIFDIQAVANILQISLYWYDGFSLAIILMVFCSHVPISGWPIAKWISPRSWNSCNRNSSRKRLRCRIQTHNI